MRTPAPPTMAGTLQTVQVAMRRTQGDMKSFRDIFRPRKSAGTPDGGRFTTKTHSEPKINLAPQLNAPSRYGDIAEEDGTYWNFEGDQYREWYTSTADKIQLEVSTFEETGITQLVVLDCRSPKYQELACLEFEGDRALTKAMDHGKELRAAALQATDEPSLVPTD